MFIQVWLYTAALAFYIPPLFERVGVGFFSR